MPSKNIYFSQTCSGKLHDSILLESELTDLWLMAGKQRLKYASLRNDFNEPFDMSLMCFVARG